MSNRSRNLGLLVKGLYSAQQNLSTLINRAVAPMGLNMSQLTILARFSSQPNRSQTITSLVTSTDMNQPAVTKIVSHLVEKTWLTTEPDPTDARKKSLKITSAGLGVVIKAYGELSPAIDRTCESFSDEEVDQLNDLLSKLNNG